MRVPREHAWPDGFSEPQRAFIEAWYSMTNIRSLDSHRVRTLNARLVLRELADVCFLIERGVISHLHRREVAEEAREILQADPVFGEILPDEAALLQRLLKDPQYAGGKNASKAAALRFAVEDVATTTEQVYSETLRDRLGQAVCTSIDSTRVVALTGALLTDLATSDFTLSNLYGFHAFFLRGSDRPGSPPRSFGQRFQYLMDWLVRDLVPHEVVLKLTRAGKLRTVPSFGDWRFDASLVQEVAGNRAEASFCRPGRGVVFASCQVTARDHRHAGTQALGSWQQTADLLSFDFLEDALVLDSHYRCKRLHDKRVRMGNIWLQEPIPNPSERTTPDALRAFTVAVENTLKNSQLEPDDRKQIRAAFRYYRLGWESDSVEGSFLTWWIALESLLRTVRADAQITGIAETISEMMGLTYVERVARDLLSTLRFLGKDLSTPVQARLSKTEPAELELTDLVSILQEEDERTALLATLDRWPLYRRRLISLGEVLSDAARAKEAVTSHERHVRWQIHRLYRVRNEIVHTAKHSIPLTPLAAHLEYYLKTSVQQILALSVAKPYVRRISEICHRVVIAKLRLYEDLKRGTVPTGLLSPLSLV